MAKNSMLERSMNRGLGMKSAPKKMSRQEKVKKIMSKQKKGSSY